MNRPSRTSSNHAIWKGVYVPLAPGPDCTVFPYLYMSLPPTPIRLERSVVDWSLLPDASRRVP